MTLDETIKEAKITAAVYEKEAHKYTQHGGSFYEDKAKIFRESAKDFEQIVEWLEELKAYREADRPQGEWIVDILNYKSVCPVCGAKETAFIYGTEIWYGLGESKFCPSCGARMLVKDTNVLNKEGANDD